MNPKATLRHIGYIVKMFPRISETFILNEILEVEKRGIQVTIFSLKKPNEGRFHPQLAQLKARVLYLDDLDIKKWSAWLAREWDLLGPCQARMWPLVADALAEGDAGRIEQIWQAAWIAARARRLAIDHVHAHFASVPSTMAHFAHAIGEVPYTFTAHAKDIYVYTQNEHLLLDKLRTAARVITVTEFNRRYLQTQDPDAAERIRVIHNGIDLELFAPDSTRQRAPGLILAVGRLVRKKGFHVLLESLSRLKQQGVPFTCRIVGDGAEYENLMVQRQALNLEHEVRFDGALHRDEVLPLMQQATLLALPCIIAEDGNVDALPTVLLEALGCGLPVVSTDLSGIPEIVEHQKCGLLCPPGDAAALATHIEQLLESPGRRQEFAVEGRRQALNKFNLSRNVDALLDVMAEAHGEAGRGPHRTLETAGAQHGPV